MDYRNENYYKRKYSKGWGWSPQNTFTKPRHFQNDKNPRDYHQSDKNPRDYHLNDKNLTDHHQKPRDSHIVKKPRYYHRNDQDFRPQSYRFYSMDRDDRPLLPEIDAKERDRNRSTTAIENAPWLNYVRNVKNEKKLLIDDEDFKKWNIGVEFNVTRDKPDKLHWQTKEQMGLYGMVGGHLYEEDGRTGEISKEKCSLYGQSGLPLRESSWRSRSMSRTREPRSISRPTPWKPRSRSVCFSQNIMRIEYECESESDINDFSQDNMEIDDTSRNDVLESESSDEQSSDTKLIPENSKAGITKVKSNSKEPKYIDHIKMTGSDELKSTLLKSNEENSGNRIRKKLGKYSVQDVRCNGGGDSLVKESVQDVKNNEVKDTVQDVRSNEGGDSLVKDSVQDVKNNEGGGKLVKDTVQDVKINEGDTVQDVRSNEGGDKLVKDTVQDVRSDECVENYPSNLGANICPPSSDNQPIVRLAFQDKMRNVKSNKKFHGFGEDFSNDLRNLELRTSIIKMQNQYEEDCQEFAQNSYDVIMESTLADGNQTFYHYSQANGKLVDSFQDYLIPIDDIFEDDTVHMVATDEPFLRSQEEEFDTETNVALSNVLTKLNTNKKSSEKSRPIDNDLLSLHQESPLFSYRPTQTNPTLEIRAQLYRAQSESRQSNPQQLVEDIKICQNAVQVNGVHSVSEDPTDNETSKSDEYALDSHVENQDIECHINNNSVEKLNLNYLAKKPTSLKMKIFKVEGNRFKVENIEDDAIEDTVHSQTANPLCVSILAPAITSKSSSKSQESSRFSIASASAASNASFQLRDCVFCSVCGAKFPRSLIDPGEMLEDIRAWQCQGCALCILCFLRDSGERLLVCCKCGYHYHKTCAGVEQIDLHESFFVCKNCTA